RPLDKSADSDRFYDDPDGCDYPILTGRNFFSYSYDPTFIDDLEPPFQWSVDEDVNPERSAKQRIREKKVRSLKQAIYDAFDGTGSQVSFVNELLAEERGAELSAEDVLLPSTEYRLGFRRVARGTDEKSMISAVVPSGPVCDYSFYVVDPFEMNPEEDDLSETPLHGVFTDDELFAATGLLNSIVFDFLMRTKVETHIVK
ncbi:MAG: type II restriction endonuclease subunit M, partial [Halobaculum sp.]